MFPILIFGVALAIAAVLLAPLITRQGAAKVAAIASVGVAVLAGAMGLFALFTGRGTLTIAALIVLAVCVIVMLAGGRSGQGGWRQAGGRSNWSRARQGGRDRCSNIETDWLSMTLDHGSGDVDGEVLQGRFAGRRLRDLTVEEVLALLRECQSDDPQAAQLLEAYLDRVAAGWRGAEGGRHDDASAGGGGGAGGPMSREEALDVLGLSDDATDEDVRAAHRRMMREHHPDRGGSTWLAARINQAKEILLGER